MALGLDLLNALRRVSTVWRFRLLLVWHLQFVLCSLFLFNVSRKTQTKGPESSCRPRPQLHQRRSRTEEVHQVFLFLNRLCSKISESVLSRSRTSPLTRRNATEKAVSFHSLSTCFQFLDLASGTGRTHRVCTFVFTAKSQYVSASVLYPSFQNHL